MGRETSSTHAHETHSRGEAATSQHWPTPRCSFFAVRLSCANIFLPNSFWLGRGQGFSLLRCFAVHRRSTFADFWIYAKSFSMGHVEIEKFAVQSPLVSPGHKFTGFLHLSAPNLIETTEKLIFLAHWSCDEWVLSLKHIMNPIPSILEPNFVQGAVRKPWNALNLTWKPPEAECPFWKVFWLFQRNFEGILGFKMLLVLV